MLLFDASRIIPSQVIFSCSFPSIIISYLDVSWLVKTEMLKAEAFSGVAKNKNVTKKYAREIIRWPCGCVGYGVRATVV